MPSVAELKRCSKCAEWKARSEFRRDRQNPDGLRARCKDCTAKADRVYRQQIYTPERYKEDYQRRGKSWVASHRQQVRARIQSWRDRKSEDWRAHNRAKDRTWRKENPELRRVQEQRRRARKQNAPGDYTAAEWRALCEWFGNICLACGRAKKLTPDHVVPLSRGGSNHIRNIQPLCGDCNSQKHARTVDYRDPERLQAFLEVI